jgi:hypothetical protein
VEVLPPDITPENISPAPAGYLDVAVISVEATVVPTPEIGVPAVIATPENGVTKQQPAFYDDETLDPGDLVLPRLNIVQKVGELSNVFPSGSVLLNGQLVLAKAPEGSSKSTVINLMIVGFQPTTFTEKVEGGLRGRFFRKESDVVASGGTLDWNEHKATKKPLYQRLATALVLIEKPEGLDASSFPMKVGGKNWALALYSMKGTSYTNAAKHFKTARQVGHLQEHGYRGGFWTFQSQLKKFESNYAFVPVVTPNGTSTEEFRTALKNLIGF